MIPLESIRLLCRILVALVALYAANDGLLHPFVADGSDPHLSQPLKRGAMPAIVAAVSEDDRDHLPIVDGPVGMVPLEGASGTPLLAGIATPPALARSPPTMRPLSRSAPRGPPHPRHALA